MKEISDWIEETYLKFAEHENKDLRRSLDEFLQRYVFSDVYEIFFGSIPTQKISLKLAIWSFSNPKRANLVEDMK